MSCQFHATVPGQRAVQAEIHSLAGFDQSGDDHGGTAAGDLHDVEKPGLPVDECRDLALVRSDHQIAFQVPKLAVVLQRPGAGTRSADHRRSVNAPAPSPCDVCSSGSAGQSTDLQTSRDTNFHRVAQTQR